MSVSRKADKQTPEMQADADIAGRWLDEVQAAEKKWAKYRKRVEKIVKRYADEQENATSDDAGAKRLNILWANIETIKPALYSKTPVPEVGRRNKDKDPVGREAGEVVERCLAFCNDSYDFDSVIEDAVHDYALGSLGIARVIYEPLIENDGEKDVLQGEYSKIDYVHWSDFMTNIARNWGEVRWVLFRQYLTREELLKLSPEHGNKVGLNHSPEEHGKDDPNAESFKKCLVYEIWDKQSGKVYYIASGYADAPLKVSAPFCNFNGFFPCPRPMLGVRGKSIIPTPDYALYQDQATLIDELTNKIYLLTTALKVAGFYNSKVKELASLLDGNSGNVMISVEDWGSFAQGGGMQGAVAFMPLKEVVEALLSLYEARNQAKQDMYETTGLSDIVRGASDPRETAAAQSIKNQWGSLRIRKRQKDVQRFARDLMRLKAEVIAEHFSLDTMQKMSGVKLPTLEQKAMAQMAIKQGSQPMQPPQPPQQPPQPGMPPAMPAAPAQPPQPPMPPELIKKAKELAARPTWEEVHNLLRNDRLRSFSINIETDSTMEPDEQAEKESRIEFITAITGFLKEMGPIIQSAPETAPMLGEFLTFGVRSFRVGAELESTIESTMEQLQERLMSPKEQPPDPEVIKSQTEIKKTEIQSQTEIKKTEMQSQTDLMKHKENIQLELLKNNTQKEMAGIKIAADQERSNSELQYRHEASQQQSAQDEQRGQRMKGSELSKETVRRRERSEDSERQALLANSIIQAVNGLTKAVKAPRQAVRDKGGKLLEVNVVEES
jgi:hypothetical protein